MKTYTDKPHPIILSAVSKLAAFVKPTYGAAGLGILIDSGYQQSVVDDGYAIIQQFELENELEDAVVKYVKEVSKKTNDRAGDGTTTSIIFLEALLNAALEGDELDFSTRKDFTLIADELQKALAKAVKDIKKQAKPVKTIAELHAIAQNAYRNPVISKMVAELVHEIGSDGVITIEESDTMDTHTKVVTGLSFDRGYISQFMATQPGGVETIKNAAVIVTDETLVILDPIMPVIQSLLNQGKKEILIIAENVDGLALNTLVLNKLKNNANILAVRAPGYGDGRYDLLGDIAVAVGATFMTAKLGRGIGTLTEADLGHAKSITVSKDDCTIVEGAGKAADIKKRIEDIRPSAEKGAEFDKQKAKERMAKLSSGVGVISVGAPTESETRAIRMKVEDAVHATMLAHKEGMVDGGGVMYGKLKTGSDILDKALKAPRAVLMENGAHAVSDGVQDAAGVAIAALESAVSIASTLITSGGIIAPSREDEDKVAKT